MVQSGKANLGAEAPAPKGAGLLKLLNQFNRRAARHQRTVDFEIRRAQRASALSIQQLPQSFHGRFELRSGE
jgi:hypothetical protein